MRGLLATTRAPYCSRCVCSANGSRRGRPSGRAGQPSGTTATGTTCAGSASSAVSSSANAVVIVVERAAEPDRGRREQQVLDRRKDRRPDGHFEPALEVGAHDDVHRRGRDPAGRAALDLGEQLRREARLRERAAVRLPRALGELADRGARRRVAHDTNSHGWRFSALGACVAASRSGASSSSVTRLGAELAARALAADDGEEVAIGHGSRSPTRANEFTYMMRRLGPNAQCRNASVSVPPMRSITSGVMLLNARSGSSVSIS